MSATEIAAIEWLKNQAADWRGDCLAARAQRDALEADVRRRDELLRCWWFDCGVEDEDKAEGYMIQTRDLLGLGESE